MSTETATPTTPQHGEVVRVQNNSPRTVTFTYAKGKYPVPAGTSAAVPVAAAKRSLGDWDARDNPDVNIMPRTNEQNRLSTLYGLCGDPFYSDDPRETFAASEEVRGNGKAVVPMEDYTPTSLIDGRKQYRHPRLPDVEVYDLSGRRVVTVLDDPDGTIGSGQLAREAARDESSMLKDTIAALQAQQTQILSALANIDPHAAAELATSANDPARGDLPALHGDNDEDSAGVGAADAMSIMDDALGIKAKAGAGDGDDADDSDQEDEYDDDEYDDDDETEWEDEV